MNHSDLDLHDPIDESFPIMVDASKRFCRGRNSPDDDLCFKYHHLWPYLRRIGLRPWRDTRHFIDSFREIKEDDRPTRVLISGCADYSLLAFVLQAFRANVLDSQIAVLDVCEAPLVVNRWYAERLDAKIDTIVCDILEYQSDTAFDVVTTSNILNRFPGNEQPRVLDKWRNLLRPGGRVVSAQNISNDAPIGEKMPDADDLNRKCARILEQAKENISLIDIPPETLAAYYKDWVVTRALFPFRTTNDLKTLFEDNGFRIDTAKGLSIQEKREKAKLHAKRNHFDRIRFIATKVR